VTEDGNGLGKTDAVFTDVVLVLFLVPLEPKIPHCIDECMYIQSPDKLENGSLRQLVS
jgi:hypothetical protein